MYNCNTTLCCSRNIMESRYECYYHCRPIQYKHQCQKISVTINRSINNMLLVRSIAAYEVDQHETGYGDILDTSMKIKYVIFKIVNKTSSV